MQQCNKMLVFGILCLANCQPAISTHAHDQRNPVKDISPYRYHMLLLIAEHKIQNQQWKQSPLCRIVIGKNGGKPLSVTLIKGTGEKELDRSLLAMLQSINYLPLPKWYSRKSISFQVQLLAQ